MPRASWNPNTPEILGVEFIGVGRISHPIWSFEQYRALAFTAQRTGEVDEIALCSGPQSVDTVLGIPHFMGHRAPYIVELYPAATFGHTTPETSTVYTSTITASSNVVDEANTAPEGDELANPNDNLYLAQTAGGFASATVHMPSANTFPLDRHVKAIGIDTHFLRQMRVRRVDQNGTALWNRVLPAGLKVEYQAGWFMSEAYIEAGATANWSLWTPTAVRQFASGTGSRRLIVESLSKTQSQIIDLLRIRVQHVLEERIGVGVFELPSTNYTGWFTVPFNQPGTSTPATIVNGTEYILVIRTPYANADYQVLTRFDLQALDDTRPKSGTFVHFSGLDWDLHSLRVHFEGTIRELGGLVAGLPAIRLLNDGAQTVDSQPYEWTLGARVHSGQTAVQNDLAPDPLEQYGQLQVVVSGIFQPTAPLSVTVKSSPGGATLIGPLTITYDDYLAGEFVDVGTPAGEYAVVTVPFSPSVSLPAEVDIEFTSTSPVASPWLVSTLMARTTPGTGDQTFAGFATGVVADGEVLQAISTYGRGDIQVALIADPDPLTGLNVTTRFQALTGGECEPCGPDDPLGCVILDVPYNRVCWNPSDLGGQLAAYEVQRQENLGEWTTVASLTPTVTGAPPTCWDDWSAPFDIPLCYRTRQQRTDGAFSAWSSSVCQAIESPPGADITITAPDDPTLNVAFPEAHRTGAPEKAWEFLDGDQTVFRSVYGRDNYIAFQPLERLGVRFKRRLLVSAMCTQFGPSLDVMQPLRDICTAPVSYLVVRNARGDRWYATVAVTGATQITDPTLGDLWLADITVTETSTPVFSSITPGIKGHT